MLQHLLQLMADGRPRAQAELAEALDVPQPLVVSMIEQLVRRGYLTESETCASGCDGCALHAACGAAPGGALMGLRLWSLTKKGLAAVARD